MKVGTRGDSPPVKAVMPCGTLRKRPATRSGCRAVNPKACGAPCDMPYTNMGNADRPGRRLACSPARRASRINRSLSGPLVIPASEVPRIASCWFAAMSQSDCPSASSDASVSGVGAPNGPRVANDLVFGPRARRIPRGTSATAGTNSAKSPSSNTSICVNTISREATPELTVMPDSNSA